MRRGRYLLAGAATACLSTIAYAEDATELDTIQIHGQTTGVDYVAPTAFTATKSDAPLIEAPVSVVVVPQAVIEDQRDNRLQEVLENVSGVRSNNNAVEGYVYKIRGFTTQNIYRNGLMMTVGIPTIQDMANIQRVEVVKGPASVLYGRVDPGGVINLVTKTPSLERYYKLEQEFGTYDHQRTQIEATGALNEAGSASYLLTSAYQHDGSYRQYQGGHRVVASPVINFKFSENTELTLDFQYMKNDAQSDTGFPAVNGRPASIPLSRSFQEPNDPLDDTKTYNAGYEFKHRFNDTWSVTNRFLYSDGTMHKLNVYGTSIDAASGMLDRATQYQKLEGQVYSSNIDLNGKFDALGARHNLLVGVDYLHDYYDYKYGEGSGVFPINIYNPVHGGISASDYQEAKNGVGYNYLSSFLAMQTGIYVQDQMTWADKWHLLLGGRYDSASVEIGRSSVSKSDAIDNRRASPTQRDYAFSPRAGLLYQFQSNLSGYVSYSQSFGTNNGVSATGQAFDPEESKQYEIGFKAELMSGLSANVAAYQLTKQNILTDDPSTPDPFDSIAVGEARSRGVEVDVLGQLTDHLSMVAAYAYTVTKITEDNSGLQGNQLDNVPRNTGRVFMTYDFGGATEGWRVGGGFYAAGQAQGDKQNDFIIPGYVRLDAFAGYSGKLGSKRWTAQLNLRNLLDKDYFEGTDIYYNAVPGLNLIPAEPLTAVATLRLEI